CSPSPKSTGPPGSTSVRRGGSCTETRARSSTIWKRLWPGGLRDRRRNPSRLRLDLHRADRPDRARLRADLALVRLDHELDRIVVAEILENAADHAVLVEVDQPPVDRQNLAVALLMVDLGDAALQIALTSLDCAAHLLLLAL